MAKKATNGKPNICLDCQKAVCGCSWSRDFTPVPGWTAEKTYIMQCYVKGYEQAIETYHITACPQFVPDKEYVPQPTVRPVKCLSTGKVYRSIYEASWRTGVCGHSIRQACKGNQRHAGGMVWRYADGETDG